ncbi:hypothetical protein N7520_005740 [Penicillium odoratum]|uniref:uncharacterized protein n=1 Tax=Penicillium odoratum TaxID=1167516 RepID=UPI00254843C2|nr:uncharacterized protein N7520_005740 [Penicillium odoratum]KAJ5758584.1 hypothetical protein N7520_005740 [Penicillium odoratum]
MDSKDRADTSKGSENSQAPTTNTKPHSSKFRFKSTTSNHSSRKRHHSPKPKERTYKRRPPHRSRSSNHIQENPSPRSRSLSPNSAFRESLFDAMGDDEGAAYWEGVYGQPIHNYAVPQTEGPDGELEAMDEEQYAAYVRAQMWERTHAGMIEAQAQWREERRRRKLREQRGRAEDAEKMSFEKAMEDSLRRGAERKRRKRWGEVWETYLARWEEIAKAVKEVTEKEKEKEQKGGDGSVPVPASKSLRNLLFWPVESGKRIDVATESVEEFMRHAPSSEDLMVILKAERVRWHPDKIQHRYSGLGIDDVVLRSVTEVFQIIDRMWNERQPKT